VCIAFPWMWACCIFNAAVSVNGSGVFSPLQDIRLSYVDLCLHDRRFALRESDPHVVYRCLQLLIYGSCLIFTVRATRVVSRVCSTGIARQQCIITWYSCPAYLRYSVLCFIIQWSVVVNVNITVMLRWIKVRFLAVCYSVISVGAEGATERSPLQFLIWGHR